MKAFKYSPLVIAIASLPLHATDAIPAVSSTNLKADFSFGSSDGEDTKIAAASLAIPIGNDFGAQLDTAMGEVGNLDFGGAGLHLFWRNPESMLIGFTAMAVGYEDDRETLQRFGVESEYYFEDFTVTAALGRQTDHQDDTFFGELGASYYINPNLKFSLLYSGFSDDRFLSLGTEYRSVSFPNASIFLTAGTDDEENGQILGGVRFSFGGSSQSLKDRDRYDDPVNLVSNLMRSSAQAVKDRTGVSSSPTVANTPSTSTVVSGGGENGGSSGGGGIC